jgi:hypothetical protein
MNSGKILQTDGEESRKAQSKEGDHRTRGPEPAHSAVSGIFILSMPFFARLSSSRSVTRVQKALEALKLHLEREKFSSRKPQNEEMASADPLSEASLTQLLVSQAKSNFFVNK